MAHVRGRKHSSAVQPLINQSLVALAAFVVPMQVHAQTADVATADKTLPAVNVKEKADTPYKADRVTNPKITQPLVDTPQTISVIKKEIIQEQNATNLMEVLRNTPGITMQLGENGNTSSGDTFQMRGFSTQSSIFIDGIRDLGAITRDSFNLEQVEVSKGPAGADIGRGAASGYINLVSKVPYAENFNNAMLTGTTEDNRRISADFNRKIGDTAAVRLNIVGQSGGVPGRNEIENNSYGIAPSFAFGLGTPTRFYLYSQHVRQDNIPDGGVPTIGLPGFFNATAELNNGARVNSENYYGTTSDYEDVSADMVTFRMEHDFGKGVTLRNTSRYAKSEMDRILTGIGTTLTATVPGDPSTWTTALSRQAVMQENEILANITNLTAEFDTGSLKHNLSTGLELSYEKQSTVGFSSTGVTIPSANLYSPNPNVTLPNPYRTGLDVDGSTTTIATYVFDTIKLNKSWQVNGGVRFEHYNTDTDLNTTQNTPSGTIVVPADQGKSGNLTSWKVGGVYKPTSNSSVYAAYANSYTPPGSSNFSLSATAGNINQPNFNPQKTTNMELGTKWDLKNNTLALTAALYRTENENEITQLDPINNVYGQFGKRRVQGVELTAAGQLTDKWQISAGVATMNTKILQGSATGNNTTGAPARWSPKLTATLWTTYKLSNWTIGGGARYVSDQERAVDPTVTLTQNMPKIPSFWVADAMVAYQVSKNVSLQLNAYNIFDKEYINTLNNGGARYTPGAPRYGALTANFAF